MAGGADEDFRYVDGEIGSNQPTVNLPSLGDFHDLARDGEIETVYRLRNPTNFDDFAFISDGVFHIANSQGFRELEDFVAAEDLDFEDSRDYYTARKFDLHSTENLPYFDANLFRTQEAYEATEDFGILQADRVSSIPLPLEITTDTFFDTIGYQYLATLVLTDLLVAEGRPLSSGGSRGPIEPESSRVSIALELPDEIRRLAEWRIGSRPTHHSVISITDRLMQHDETAEFILSRFPQYSVDDSRLVHRSQRLGSTRHTAEAVGFAVGSQREFFAQNNSYLTWLEADGFLGTQRREEYLLSFPTDREYLRESSSSERHTRLLEAADSFETFSHSFMFAAAQAFELENLDQLNDISRARELGFVSVQDYREAVDMGFEQPSEFYTARAAGFDSMDEYTIARTFGLESPDDVAWFSNLRSQIRALLERIGEPTPRNVRLATVLDTLDSGRAYSTSRVSELFQQYAERFVRPPYYSRAQRSGFEIREEWGVNSAYVDYLVAAIRMETNEPDLPRRQYVRTTSGPEARLGGPFDDIDALHEDLSSKSWVSNFGRYDSENYTFVAGQN